MAEPLAADFVALQRALAGRYSLERELGRGGMGIVFLARDVALDRPVAIKLLPPAMAAQSALRERFLREAQLAAKLSHPNIIPIHSVDEVGDLVFFVMAYVEGETLGHRLRSKGPLTADQGTRVIREVAWALAYAHLHGIVHRDIKPDNILLEQATGRALVSDFGIARLTDAAGATAAGEVLGTAQYMSPEQACGEKVDGRSDLYALGVVAFYALSGKLPFEAPDVPGLLAMQITRPAPPLVSVCPGVPGTLAQAIDRCLAKDPAQRFQTGEALADAVAESTTLARELPTPVRVWMQRGQGVKTAIGVWTTLGTFMVVQSALTYGFMGFSSLLIVYGPLAAYVLYRGLHTQRLLATGYTVADIRAAIRERNRQLREESAFEASIEPPLFAKILRKLTLAALGVTGAAGVVLITLPDGTPWSTTGRVLAWFATASAVTLGGAALGAVFPGRRIAPKDPSRSFQARIWNSRIGVWFAKIAAIGMKRAPLPAASAHRPTEIAIGLAAEALFEALPRETRKELRDLPAVIGRLEADAQGLRARVDELNALAAGAGDEGPAAGSATLAVGDDAVAGTVAGNRRKARAELLARRDATAGRLAVSVAALENIRLDLLRLRAGAGTVDQLSADLSAARDIWAGIDAALAGRREVDALLAPGTAAAPRPD